MMPRSIPSGSNSINRIPARRILDVVFEYGKSAVHRHCYTPPRCQVCPFAETKTTGAAPVETMVTGRAPVLTGVRGVLSLFGVRRRVSRCRRCVHYGHAARSDNHYRRWHGMPRVLPSIRFNRRSSWAPVRVIEPLCTAMTKGRSSAPLMASSFAEALLPGLSMRLHLCQGSVLCI